MVQNHQPNVHPGSIIPEFNPNITEIKNWLEVIDFNANMYDWSDQTIIFHALNNLRGTAKLWYDSFIQTERGWHQFNWQNWKDTLNSVFQSNRNIHKMLLELMNHHPTRGCSLYDFYFEHLGKINKLNLNFSEKDKISLIVGAINDINISTAVEACNMSELNVLGAYLKNRIYLMKEPDRTMQASNLAGTSGQNRSIFPQKSQEV